MNFDKQKKNTVKGSVRIFVSIPFLMVFWFCVTYLLVILDLDVWVVWFVPVILLVALITLITVTIDRNYGLVSNN